ncbi:MAG TPA: TonB-dependent receptor [Vicinamibacterales bacterium]
MFLVLALALVQAPLSSISGRVVDASGGALAGASVTATCGNQAPVTVLSDSTGAYRFDRLPAARCRVSASLDGFVTSDRVADATASVGAVDFRLAVSGFAQHLIVTPTRGEAEDASRVAQSATVLDRSALETRPFAIVTQALKEEAGVLAQQTTASQGSPVLRGFTGQRNLYLIDGVRYNTAAWRDGPSQYMAWLPASDVDHIELVRGPASAQYGSDALGGIVGVFAPALTWSGPRQVRGTLGLTVGAANQLATSDAAASFHRDRVSFRGSATVGSVSDLRAGEGIDSHSAVTRYLGLPSSVVGGKLENTGYSTRGFAGAAQFSITSGNQLTLSYRRADQEDAHRYDQEIGGNGRYRSEFGPQRLDFAFARFESARAGFFDAVSATMSINRQDDGRLEQQRPGQRIDSQVNITTAMGYAAQATRSWTPRFRTMIGGEVFDETIDGSRTFLEPNGAVVRARPDIPNGTGYRTTGLFVQQTADVIPDRLTLRGGLRYGHYRFTSTRDAALGVPEQDIPVSDTTFNASAVYAAAPGLTLTMSVSRGFRAANAFDFGAIGLNGGAGFEISPQRAVELNALRGSTDGATAVSTGAAVGGLNPESMMAYEGGVRWRTGRVSTSLTAFNMEFHDAIERRTLIFPSSILGLDLSGYTVIQQDAIGRAYVQGEARPIVTRVNVSRSRILGYEAETNVQIATAWRARGWASMARGTELETGLPRRRMPPGMGGATLTFQPSGARWWIEGTMLTATKQDRFSDADIGDARIGASRTPAAIATFFNGTAVDRGLVRNGILLETGETLQQVQARVMGSSTLLAMFTETPGFTVFGVRGGFSLGARLDVTLIGENLGDRNYRIHGSGVDEPGINLMARLRARF